MMFPFLFVKFPQTDYISELYPAVLDKTMFRMVGILFFLGANFVISNHPCGYKIKLWQFRDFLKDGLNHSRHCGFRVL